MNPGGVYRTKSFTTISDPRHQAPGLIRETWRTAKKHTFLFLLLAVESDLDAPLDPEKALNQMGWFRKKARK